MPWLISAFSFTNKRQVNSLTNYVYFATITNAVACIIQSQLGLSYLLSVGLSWGRQVSYFEIGRLRLPGLTTTNFDLSLLSGIALLSLVFRKVYSQNNIENQRSSKILSVLVVISSLINLYFSATRVGILISVTLLFFFYLFSKDKLDKVIYISIGSVSIFVLFVDSLFIFNANSLFARFELWQSVILNNQGSIYGNGLGYASAANRSQFADKNLLIIPDNLFLQIFLNFGLLGIATILIVLYKILKNSNQLGYACVMVIVFAGLVTEFSDYTNTFALLLIYLYSYGLKNSSKKGSLDKDSPIHF
jgi:hypothetical protein